MRFFATIEVEFDATDPDDAHTIAEEYADAIEALPGVTEAWVPHLEEKFGG